MVKVLRLSQKKHRASRPLPLHPPHPATKSGVVRESHLAPPKSTSNGPPRPSTGYDSDAGGVCEGKSRPLSGIRTLASFYCLYHTSTTFGGGATDYYGELTFGKEASSIAPPPPAPSATRDKIRRGTRKSSCTPKVNFKWLQWHRAPKKFWL